MFGVSSFFSFLKYVKSVCLLYVISSLFDLFVFSFSSCFDFKLPLFSSCLLFFVFSAQCSFCSSSCLFCLSLCLGSLEAKGGCGFVPSSFSCCLAVSEADGGNSILVQIFFLFPNSFVSLFYIYVFYFFANFVKCCFFNHEIIKKKSM